MVGSDIGGIPALIEEGVNGFIAPPDRVDELAAAIFEPREFCKETPLPEYPQIAGLPAPGDRRWRRR